MDGFEGFSMEIEVFLAPKPLLFASNDSETLLTIKKHCVIVRMGCGGAAGSRKTSFLIDFRANSKFRRVGEIRILNKSVYYCNQWSVANLTVARHTSKFQT